MLLKLQVCQGVSFTNLDPEHIRSMKSRKQTVICAGRRDLKILNSTEDFA